MSDMDKLWERLQAKQLWHLMYQMECIHIGRSTIQRVKRPE